MLESLVRPIWDPFGTPLGPLLGHLGAILGPTWAILGLSWAHLGPSWATLGPSWGHRGATLGPSWAHPGPILGHLGTILGPSWGHLGPSLRHLGPSSVILRHLRTTLGHFLSAAGIFGHELAILKPLPLIMCCVLRLLEPQL